MKLSDTNLSVECKCPYCKKDIKTEVFNLWVSTVDSGFGIDVGEVEMSAQCPKCKATFDIDFLS